MSQQKKKTTINSQLPKLKKILTPQKRSDVMSAGKEDDHNLTWPTHYIEKNGEISGAVSIIDVPIISCWAHTQKMNARDSLMVHNIVDTLLIEKGKYQWFIACGDNSPFVNKMERFGYSDKWPTNLFYKDVIGDIT